MLFARASRGFTLVEVMVSLGIFMVASMGLLPLLLSGLKVNHDNSLHGQARRLAGELMAELQVADYAGLAGVSEEPLLIGDIELERRVEQNAPLAGQSLITVTAFWQQQGQNHRYQLQTTRSEP